MTTTLRLRGGRVIDPTNGVDAPARDVYVRDGRIVALAPARPRPKRSTSAAAL